MEMVMLDEGDRREDSIMARDLGSLSMDVVG